MTDQLSKECRTVDGVDFHITRHLDDHADLSWLGKWSSQWEYGAIDRTRTGHWSRNEYEYFIPECNAEVQRDIQGYWAHRGESRHQAWLRGQEQAKREYELMESFGDDWWMVGIVVSIDIDGVEVASASVWGVEDGYLGPDANTEQYQEDTIKELIAECKAQLRVSAVRFKKLAAQVDAIAV